MLAKTPDVGNWRGVVLAMERMHLSICQAICKVIEDGALIVFAYLSWSGAGMLSALLVEYVQFKDICMYEMPLCFQVQSYMHQ